MSNQWFAGNFCPSGAVCSTGKGALTTNEGTVIRTLSFTSGGPKTPYLATVEEIGSNAPNGWILCNGQLLPIMQYPDLYALIGVIFGGDGRDAFAVPNLSNTGPDYYISGVGPFPER